MDIDLNLEFVTSAALYEQCLNHQDKEIAFVGASNAGKSSAINALSNKKKLAKVSKTPGKTKLFNFFKCDNGYIVDFPGYGFSKVSKAQKREWSREIPKYFQYRDNLIGVLIFTDIRHPMKESDLDMVSMLIDLKLPFKVILTKSDKVSDAERKDAEEHNKKIFSDVISFSTKDQESIVNLRREISVLLSN
ncbi:MAG: YihA family ribosome biogenesis GTP-binding protein [Gammaproteobacteria bacterium]|nr:YihA family ribosome biogenesis GTP-binding protein [Gammaproteobacteria bacterium]